MPDIASLHPVLVHIVIVGGGIGILFRWLYLTGKAPWANPAGGAASRRGARSSRGWPRHRARRRTHRSSEFLAPCARCSSTRTAGKPDLAHLHVPRHRRGSWP